MQSALRCFFMLAGLAGCQDSQDLDSLVQDENACPNELIRMAGLPELNPDPHAARIGVDTTTHRLCTIETFIGSVLETQYQDINRANVSNHSGMIVAGDINYEGPAQGSSCIVFTPNRTRGKPWGTRILASIDFDFLMLGTPYDVCNNRNWRRKCVGWDTYYRDDTQLSVEMLNRGEIVSRQVIKGHKQAGEYFIDHVDVDGLAQDFHIRLCSLHAHHVNLHVRKVSLYYGWNLQ